MLDKRIKVLSVFGTRPEAIKMAPLIKELESRPSVFQSFVVVTGQHREMLDQVLTALDVQPDYDLAVMEPRQSLSLITSKILTQLDSVIEVEQPDIVLVHGDTTTCFAAGLSAFYHQVPIGHVEAGLRTWKKYAPYPEEMNRQMTDVLADLYFAPTENGKKNLLATRHPEDRIVVTGNTVIDALQLTVKPDYRSNAFPTVASGDKMILVTMHRRENIGEPMKQVFRSMLRIVEEFSDVHFVFPVHPNPKVHDTAYGMLNGHARIHLIAPLEVVDFHNCMNQSYFILSDSGGVQEEAPSLNKPVLVLRNETERPEGIEAGTLELVGTEEANVYRAIKTLLTDKEKYKRMSESRNPYGDGRASQRIADAIELFFKN
ncbi:UDP-N-acetylglucosamine 2-epimerase (non-hydrolyzing) [Vagococcus acidifermentans]|uniref:UDP-N-acetylglucosamine 2-epimerase (non-hydrolyzing) n=2 Tax=Vagococcus acidifermentans TaxID=564710 RepID=A0A430ATU2_9ENTE|nr:UDP-N-acetylglucosamine 2-epimerase (non-hydrolyzing) [Vagococcus acidifermentans]